MYIKLFESGLVPIPIQPGSKAPAKLATGFHDWSHEGIPRAMVERFEEECPLEKGYGIGIVCGSASGICVVDIDTDDPEIMNACPPSLVRRRGKKGEARFFKYNPDLRNMALTPGGAQREKGGLGIDIICERKYIIIPPSIHPETKKPFIWLTPDDIQSGLDLLRELMPEEVDQMGAILGTDVSSLSESGSVTLQGTFESPDGRRAPHGSYNRIKAVACGLIAQKLPLDEAVNALINYDRAHHKGVTYFEDQRRMADFGADPFSNAARLYCNILKTNNEQRIRKGFEPEIPGQVREIDVDLAHLSIPKGSESDLNFKPYPRPRGIMEKFMAYCELMGKGRQDALALGGSLIMMAGLCSNRFRSDVRGLDVWPNLFVLNLGYSGFGKDASQRLIDDLFCETDLVGAANYRSGTAIIQDLPDQQERMDIIDECSWLLKAMHHGDTYQAEMVEILSLLFSRSSSRFNGISSAGKGRKQGAAWNPCVNILGSTTPAGFKESVNRAMAAKGLMPRFLMFFQKQIGDYKGQTNVGAAIKVKGELQDWINGMLEAVEKLEHPDFEKPKNLLAKKQTKQNEDISMGIRYQPHLVPMTKIAHELWIDYEELNHKKASADPDQFESAFYGRFAEIAAKVALLDRISLMQPGDDLSELYIDEDNLKWAISLVERCWENSRPLYEESTAENKVEQDLKRVINVIKEAGGLMSKKDLNRKTQWLTSKARDGILTSALESEDLFSFKAQEKGKSGPKPVYFSINHPDKIKGGKSSLEIVL